MSDLVFLVVIYKEGFIKFPKFTLVLLCTARNYVWLNLFNFLGLVLIPESGCKGPKIWLSLLREIAQKPGGRENFLESRYSHMILLIFRRIGNRNNYKAFTMNLTNFN